MPIRPIQIFAGYAVRAGVIAALAPFSLALARPAMAVQDAAADDGADTAADSCARGDIAIDGNFPASAFARCTRLGKDHFRLDIVQEDPKVRNCSPWYAFRLSGPAKANVRVDLNYDACGHRYWPKQSSDGQSWMPLSRKQVTVEKKGDVAQATLKLKTGDAPLFVAAQELIVPATYDGWMTAAARSPLVTRARLGQSSEGRPIDMLSIRQPDATPREQVVLIGRQHPPEITGATALFAFAGRLLADDPLAVRFRQRFETVVVPLMNPDGVVHGHWRHNMGQTDLNRDWGPFVQPETQIMRDMLEQMDADPARKLRLFLDFHSTQKDVVYTIPEDEVTDPAGFTKAWLARYQELVPDYEVREQAGHNANSPVSKAWVHERFRVPTATYELGDETDRQLIRKVAEAAAVAMMETLLATDPAN